MTISKSHVLLEINLIDWSEVKQLYSDDVTFILFIQMWISENNMHLLMRKKNIINAFIRYHIKNYISNDISDSQFR